MKPAQALAFLAVSAGRMLLSGNSTLKWETVNSWIAANSSRDNNGSGFFGNSLMKEGASAYADVRKERSSNGKAKVIASIVFDARQGPAATKTWEADKLDSQLKKKFGDNRRFRINV